MSTKRARSPSPPASNTTATPKIYRSSPILDRSSTFTAFYSPTLPLAALQTHPHFQSATHRIAAWRKPSKQRTVLPGAPPLYDSGFDDDGESYAGKRVAKVMEDESVTGVLVVGRWYGGVMLGPVRFKHIEDVAKEAIRKWKEAEAEAQPEKRQKLDSELPEFKRLVGELEKRDQSIMVLRKLLDEKKSVLGKPLSSSQPPSSSPAVQSPAKKVQYASMPLERLRQLDKARDATISFLLKGIDQAEKAQKDAEKAQKRAEDDEIEALLDDMAAAKEAEVG